MCFSSCPIVVVVMRPEVAGRDHPLNPTPERPPGAIPRADDADGPLAGKPRLRQCEQNAAGLLLS